MGSHGQWVLPVMLFEHSHQNMRKTVCFFASFAQRKSVFKCFNSGESPLHSLQSNTNVPGAFDDFLS